MAATFYQRPEDHRSEYHARRQIAHDHRRAAAEFPAVWARQRAPCTTLHSARSRRRGVSQPRIARINGDRETQAWCLRRAGRDGYEHHRRPPRSPISRHGQELVREARVRARAVRGSIAPDAAGVDGCGRLRAIDRLRQCREFAPCTSHRAPQGDGDSRGTGRRTLACRAPTARREHDPGAVRRGNGRRPGGVARPGAGHDPA